MGDHPDFEALSAYHDGEAQEWAAHVESCPACLTQLERMASVTAALRGPVPAVPAPVRDDVIARAIGADQPIRSVRPSRWPVRWAAVGTVAATLLAVVGAVAVFRGGDSDTTASRDQALSEAAPSTLGTRAVPGADLGPVADAKDLAARVAPALTGRTPTAESPTAAPDAPADLQAPDSRSDGAARAPDSRSDGAARAPEGATGSAARQVCEWEARSADPALGDVVYVAGASYEGTPLVVLGFARPGQPVILYAMARDGCRLVFSTPL